MRGRSSLKREARRPSRRRTGVPLGLLGFAALIGVAVGVVITEPPRAASAAGPAGYARVIDGDTLDVAGERVRVWGVDAPERDQTCEDGRGATYRCGEHAKQALIDLVAGRALACAPRDVDRYGRTVAKCSAGGEDLGGRMVRMGHALDYTRYSKGAYLIDELRARRAKAGVWQGRFMRPEDWRRAG